MFSFGRTELIESPSKWWLNNSIFFKFEPIGIVNKPFSLIWMNSIMSDE